MIKTVMPPDALPWSQIMAFGFGHLRLSPEALWSMTLREFSAAAAWHLGTDGQALRPQRDVLAALMDRFPD